MVAHKIGLLMWATDKLQKDRLLNQMSTMEQRTHENPVLVAKGHMQYMWHRSNDII